MFKDDLEAVGAVGSKGADCSDRLEWSLESTRMIFRELLLNHSTWRVLVSNLPRFGTSAAFGVVSVRKRFLFDLLHTFAAHAISARKSDWIEKDLSTCWADEVIIDFHRSIDQLSLSKPSFTL